MQPHVYFKRADCSEKPITDMTKYVLDSKMGFQMAVQN